MWGAGVRCRSPGFYLRFRTFGKSVSQRTLTQAFGAANLKRASGADSEGMRYGFTRVFARDPEKTVEVNWFDNSDRKGPHTITTDSKTYWRGPAEYTPA